MRLNWSKFRKLSLRERTLLLAALVLLPVVRVGLRLFGFRRLCRGLAWATPSFRDQMGDTGADLIRARATVLCVRRAANHGLYRANCLDQSVTVWWLLRQQHVESAIRIGVRKDTQLEAHAWVEVGSVVVSDRADVGDVFDVFEQPVLDSTGQPKPPFTRRTIRGGSS